MRKGFTLLELVVVIIIIGILATLGITQYARMIEKARGAEARAVAGIIRTLAAGYRMEQNTIVGVTAALLGIGTAADQNPSTCRASHYFAYTFAAATDPTITITATRCSGANVGKPPQGPAADTLTLDSNLLTGADTWGGTGGY